MKVAIWSDDGSCECCGKKDIPIIGVRASALGPLSYATCGLCLGMQAEMFAIVKTVISKDPAETCDGIYYDRDTDKYMSWQTDKVVPVTTGTGQVFQTRDEFVQWWISIGRPGS